MEWFGRFTRNPEERFFTWVLKSIGCAALLYTTDLNKNPKIPRQVAIKLEDQNQLNLHDSFEHAFPRFESATYIYFELIGSVASELIWFWFYNT